MDEIPYEENKLHQKISRGRIHFLINKFFVSSLYTYLHFLTILVTTPFN